MGGGGVFVLYCGNSGGVGGGVGNQFLTKMENPGRWGKPR